MENTIKPHNPITYSLRIAKKETDFYTELEAFRNKLINTAKIEYFGAISTYQKFVSDNKTEKPRKWEEYFLELLMLGVFWNVYSNNISRRARYFKFLFNGLYNIRKKNTVLKPYVDNARGYLASALLKKEQKKLPAFNITNIKLLLCWMDCTKEFTEEVDRLNNWVLFFESNPNIFVQVQTSINNFTTKFKEESKIAFGEYTKNVEHFLVEQHPGYTNKENYFFTGRREVEYHLNMVGASILNHVLQSEFNKTKNQVVLLPTCMSSGKPCKAKKQGLDMVCSHCNPSCNVSKISKELAGQGVRTVLIPHSSKFSQYLKLWANQKETGLIGVACVLNLIRGGYELIDLDIPSQCVFLDECGCKNHWHKQGGIPTELNVEQLKKILHIENGNLKMVTS